MLFVSVGACSTDSSKLQDSRFWGQDSKTNTQISKKSESAEVTETALFFLYMIEMGTRSYNPWKKQYKIVEEKRSSRSHFGENSLKVPKKVIKHKPGLARFRGWLAKEEQKYKKKHKRKVFGDNSAEQALARYLMQHVLLAGPCYAQQPPITF